jgi:hypothetical protein
MAPCGCFERGTLPLPHACAGGGLPLAWNSGHEFGAEADDCFRRGCCAKPSAAACPRESGVAVGAGAAAESPLGARQGGLVAVPLEQVVGCGDQPLLAREADLPGRRKRAIRRLNLVFANTGSIVTWRLP